MPRKREKHLHRDESRHGQVRWYYHLPGKPKLRIPGDYGTPEFMAALAVARGEAEPELARKAGKGSVRWLWERYTEVKLWTGLAEATRRQRINMMKHVLAQIGDKPASSIRRKDIIASRDARTPAQGRNFLDAIRGMFEWAESVEHVTADPTAGIPYPKREQGGPGFKQWREEEVDAYYERWPLGTKERVWIDVYLFTGARRSDAVQIGRQHVRDGVITFWTKKSRERVQVTIPLLPVLAATLAAGPCGDLAFVCGERGDPLTKETFGNYFKKACRAAGIDEGKKSAHGLRKVAATRAADNGASAHQLMALFGWTDIKMAQRYCEEANRRRLGKAAAGMLVRT